MSEFDLNARMYEDLFKVSAELEEFGTGGYRRARVRRAFLLVLTRALSAI